MPAVNQEGDNVAIPGKTFALRLLKMMIEQDATVNQELYTKGAFTYDVRWFFGIFDLPTYPNQILYYISLFSKIRCSLTYLPT